MMLHLPSPNFSKLCGKFATRTGFFFPQKMVLTSALMKELAQDLLSDTKLCSSHNTFLSVIKIYNLCVLI